jgi:peptide/nickel transport system permease protein
MSTPELVDSAAQAAAAAERPGMVRQLAGNPSVVFGTVVLLFMLVLGVLAPALGTIDPASIDPV